MTNVLACPFSEIASIGVHECSEQHSDHKSVDRDGFCVGGGESLIVFRSHNQSLFELYNVGIVSWIAAELIGYWIYRSLRDLLLEYHESRGESGPRYQQTFGFFQMIF